jgi:hypothetical protein
MHAAPYASIIEAADKLRAAVVDHLEAWEDDADAGDAAERPGTYRETFALLGHAIEATRLARDVADHHAVAIAIAEEAA